MSATKDKFPQKYESRDQGQFLGGSQGQIPLVKIILHVGDQGVISRGLRGAEPPNFCINLAFQSASTLLPMFCMVLL